MRFIKSKKLRIRYEYCTKVDTNLILNRVTCAFVLEHVLDEFDIMEDNQVFCNLQILQDERRVFHRDLEVFFL